MINNQEQSVGIKKVAEKLKKKLKENEKVSLKSYTLSKTSEQNRQNEENSSQKDPHAVKPHRKGFRISSVALKKLQQVYLMRYSENPSITHSTLICEAIDLLFAKQNRKKTENIPVSEQADFFS